MQLQQQQLLQGEKSEKLQDFSRGAFTFAKSTNKKYQIILGKCIT